MMTNMRSFHGLLALILSVQAGGQVQRSRLSSPDVQRLEAALKNTPGDLAARSALLDYYYLNGMANPAEAIPARRRHILWLIENAPAGELAGTSAATIDPSGYSLADAPGYKLASDAWRAQVAKPDVKPASLTNAAFFFKTIDKGYTVSLLERALTMDPKNKEIGARLGDQYALIIMGVTLINRNGYPLKADASLTQSTLAKQAREALTTSQNPYVLAKAGYMLAWQGSVLYFSGKLQFKTTPLAKGALERAVSLAPGEPGVAQYLEEFHKFERMEQEAERLEHGAPADHAKAIQLVEQAAMGGATATARPPSPTPQPTQATADDLKQIAVGMSREQVLKFGSPAGRITLDEDGHLIETYQYSANGTMLGTVRLTDGTVSRVQIQ